MRDENHSEDKTSRENIIREKYISTTKKSYKMLLLRLYRTALDIMLFYLAFVFFRYGSFNNLPTVGFRYNYFVTVAYAALLYWFKRTYNANVFGFFRIRSLALSQFLSQFFATTIAYLLVCFGWSHFKNPCALIILLGIQMPIDILWAYFGSEYFFHLYAKKKTLLIYRNEVDRKRIGELKGKPIERLFEIVDEVKYNGAFEDLEPKLKNYDAVFVAGVESNSRNKILKYCEINSVPGFFLPHIGDTIMQGATHIQSFDTPVLYVCRKVVDPLFAFVKRTFDIVSSGIALVVLSPIMLITALIIHFYDHGPALYK